jgi:hypothetical protein
MADHRFQMRLQCRYAGDDNAPQEQSIEHRTESGWTPLELGFKTPGFLVLVYAVLNCQHLYMRVNAAERGFELGSAEGSIDIETNADWEVQRLTVHFDVRVRRGAPSAEDTAYIIDRMRHCPVSVNLKEPPSSATTIEFLNPQ